MNPSGTKGFRPMGRRRFLQMCASSLGCAPAGCGQHGGRVRSDSSTVVVAYWAEEDKYAVGPMNDENAQFLLFLPMLRVNEDGELEGRLAQSWEHSRDYWEWTYHLRKNIKWHDGVPVTAHDVKFTADILPQFAGADWPEQGEDQEVTVVDDFTCRIRYRRPPETFRDPVYLPQHLLKDADPKRSYDWDFWNHPVGCGPYGFVRYVPKTTMEFEANPDYYRGRPKIARMILKFLPGAGSSSPELTELQSGNVDAVVETNPALVLRLGQRSPF